MGVPYALTSEQKEQRLAHPEDLLEMMVNDSIFLNSITDDESWCFAYDPQTKLQRAEWCGLPALKKMSVPKVESKDNAHFFFDSKRIIHHKFVLKDHTVNAERGMGNKETFAIDNTPIQPALVIFFRFT